MILPNSVLPVLASFAGLGATTAFNLWISRINQFFFFSRTAAPEFASTASARRITKRYIHGVLAGLVASALTFLALAFFTQLSIFASFGIALIVQALINCTAFARAHREAGVALAASQESVVAGEEAPARDRRLITVPLLETNVSGTSGMIAMLLPLFTAAALWLIPMAVLHMSFASLDKAIELNGGDFLSGLGLGFLLSSIGLCILLRYYARRRTPMARFTVRSCVLLAWIGAVAIAASTLSVLLHFAITRQMKSVVLGTVCAVAILRLLYSWTRAKQFTPAQAEQNGDQFWRWGLFYYNPSDPALFIQHRCGPGYTMNFANFLSWPITLFFLGDFGFLLFIHFHR
jgi:uncharacterized membrane protein